MKRFILFCLMAILIATVGCSFVSPPVIPETSEPESSTASEIGEASSAASEPNQPTNESSLTTEYSFEVRVMTTEDWQSYEDGENFETKTFSLTFPDSWIRDAGDAPTFHDQHTEIKIFEYIAAVKLPAEFDFAESFSKESFEDSITDTTVVGDIKIGKLAAANGEKTYALVIQNVVPEGGGEIQIDRWYPYFYVIVDGDHAYCIQFYSLKDPADDDTNAELFREILGTFRVIS